jgi:hypothetical protein
MGEPLLPAWDTVALAIPFVVILVMGMFGLDERFVNRGVTSRPRRWFCEAEGEGRRFLSDPDGRPWKKFPQQQIEARIIHSPAPEVRKSQFEDARPAPRRTSFIH